MDIPKTPKPGSYVDNRVLMINPTLYQDMGLEGIYTYIRIDREFSPKSQSQSSREQKFEDR